MNDIYLLMACLCVIAIAWVGRSLLKQWQSLRAAHKPFSTEWDRVIMHVLPQYKGFSVANRVRFQKKIQQFIKHKRFVGKAGLRITDEVKVAIAANACLLVLRQELNAIPYAEIRTVYVYPDELVVRNVMRDVSGVSLLPGLSRLTQSLNKHRVLLSWREKELAVFDFNMGRNAVLMEWIYRSQNTHLNQQSGILLHSRGAIGTWAAITAADKAFALPLLEDQKDWKESFGALNVVEFLSAATENFFTKPLVLLKGCPELYKRFQDYYQVDPCTWGESSKP